MPVTWYYYSREKGQYQLSFRYIISFVQLVDETRPSNALVFFISFLFAQARQVHPDGRARDGDYGRDGTRGRTLRLSVRSRHVVQLQHHGRYAAVRGAQQVTRLPEGLLRLVSRIREIQNGHENVGAKAAGKKTKTKILKLQFIRKCEMSIFLSG